MFTFWSSFDYHMFDTIRLFSVIRICNTLSHKRLRSKDEDWLYVFMSDLYAVSKQLYNIQGYRDAQLTQGGKRNKWITF